MSLWKSIRKGVKKFGKAINYKKTLPIIAGLGTAAVGMPALGGIISKVGGAFGGSSAQSAKGFVPDVGAADPTDWGDTQQISVNGKRDPSFDWAGAIGSASPILTGAANYFGTKATNAANAQQAQAQMDFQNQQTSTAYQRGTADMKAAGLNPMLAYSQGGASSGAGAQATMGNELGSGANSALSAAQTIQEMQKRRSEIEQLGAQTNLTDAQARQSDAQTLNLAAGTKNLGLDGITKEIQNRYSEDKFRTEIRLGNSAARLNELRQPKEETTGKAADLVGRGLDAISDLRDAAANGTLIEDAERNLRYWSAGQAAKYKSTPRRYKGN